MRKLIKRLMIRFLIQLMRWARRRSLRDAIKQAQKITDETGKTCLIYFINGEYKCYTKQEIKKKKHLGKFKALSMQQLLKKAEMSTWKTSSNKTNKDVTGQKAYTTIHSEEVILN